MSCWDGDGFADSFDCEMPIEGRCAQTRSWTLIKISNESYHLSSSRCTYDDCQFSRRSDTETKKVFVSKNASNMKHSLRNLMTFTI